MSRTLKSRTRRLERATAAKQSPPVGFVIYATDEADADRQWAEIEASGAPACPGRLFSSRLDFSERGLVAIDVDATYRAFQRHRAFHDTFADRHDQLLGNRLIGSAC